MFISNNNLFFLIIDIKNKINSCERYIKISLLVVISMLVLFIYFSLSLPLRTV